MLVTLVIDLRGFVCGSMILVHVVVCIREIDKNMCREEILNMYDKLYNIYQPYT